MHSDYRGYRRCNLYRDRRAAPRTFYAGHLSARNRYRVAGAMVGGIEHGNRNGISAAGERDTGSRPGVQLVSVTTPLDA